MKLNLGCGDRKKEGYCNVDCGGEPDVRCDLSKYPWLFEDASADEILTEHFLEHVVDFEQTMFEIHRILKPEGILHFKVPHFRSVFTPWHLHLHQFSVYTCQRLGMYFPYCFGGKQLFDFVSLRLNYPFIRKPISGIFSFFANINPLFWDFCGFPIDEIECWVKKHTEV